MRDGPMRVTKRANITNRSDKTDAQDGPPVDEPKHRTDTRSSLVTPLRLLAVTVLALGVANCSSAPRSTGGAKPSASAKVDPKYGVKPSPRVVAGGSKVPKGGGRAMVGKPYTVAGRKFVPHENENYVAVGTASWYGAAFHGRKTANGEVFDKYSFAAAHPTLPLPSYVRVTNLSNKRSMIVRVNDRGPFHGNRLIDLSKNAAEALDFHRQGTARVKVEYVGRASLGGSDDRKLLATLNADAPATIPAVAPSPAAPKSAPVVAPAPVMVASAESVAPVAQPEVAAVPPAAVQAPVAPVAATDSPRPTARTLVARSAAPEPAAAPVEVAALPQPALPPPARTVVAPKQTLAFTEPSGASPLTELVSEVGASQAADVPLPPSRPTEMARRRTLVAIPAVAQATQDVPAPTHTRRALVANLGESATADRAGEDRAGVYFEPMPLSQLTPQRFVAFGN